MLRVKGSVTVRKTRDTKYWLNQKHIILYVVKIYRVAKHTLIKVAPVYTYGDHKQWKRQFCAFAL